MIYRYPPEVHEFVKEHCTQMRDKYLAAACNEALGTSFTAKTIKSFRANHGYKNGLGRLKKEEYWEHRKKTWPAGMHEYIRDNSWGVSSREMAERVNEKFGTDFTPARMNVYRQRYGIRSGLTGWFQKAHPPGNKGKKLEEYVKDPGRLEDIRRRIGATQFKKGDRPYNELPVGSIVTNTDGYQLIKVRMEGTAWERWDFLQRHVWEQHNGLIPPGHAVIFKDNNKQNCDISNLMLVTKGESAALTRLGLRFEDPDLTEAAAGMIRLKQKATKIRKEKRNARRRHEDAEPEG